MFGWLSWGLVMHCQWVWRLVAVWGALWDWLKVFRVGGAACGCSVGIGNPWQTLPLLLSSLMESEESLEVASVRSTPSQSRDKTSAQHCRAFSPFTPRATPILSWSLFISSVSSQIILPHANELVAKLFKEDGRCCTCNCFKDGSVLNVVMVFEETDYMYISHTRWVFKDF